MPRYFDDETTELRRRDPNKQLKASLERLVTFYPPQSIHPGGGLYYGPGIVLIFHLDVDKLKLFKSARKSASPTCFSCLARTTKI